MEPVVQPFEAVTSQYVDSVRGAERTALAFAAANAAVAREVRALREEMNGLARDTLAAAAAGAREASAARDQATASAAAAAAGARQADAATRQARGSEAAAAGLNSAAEAAARLARADVAADAAGDQFSGALAETAVTAKNAQAVLDEYGVTAGRVAVMNTVAAGAVARLDNAEADMAAQAAKAAMALAAQGKVTTGKAAATGDLTAHLAELAAAEEVARNKALTSAAALTTEADAARAAAADQGALTRMSLATGIGQKFLASALNDSARATDAQALKLRSAADAAAAAAVPMAAMVTIMDAAAAAETKAAAAATGTQKRMAAMLTLGKLFTGGLWTFAAWHYIIDGAIEFGIIIAGATIALTAFGLAGAKSADAIVTHFQALTVVQSATGRALAPLTSQFQRLQLAMAPKVIQLYGDALTVVAAKTGVFARLATSAGNVLDAWGAKAAVALTRSATASEFASRSAGYLNGVLGFLAQTFGVLGNLMRAAMDTHIAEILLGIATAAMSVLRVITSLPTPLVAVALGLHGIWLWGRFGAAIFGSLAARAVQLGVNLTALAVKFGFLTGEQGASAAASMGATAAQMGKVATAAEATATATSGAAAAIAEESAAMSSGAVAAAELGVAEEGLAARTGLLAGASALLEASTPFLWVAAAAVAIRGIQIGIQAASASTSDWAASLQRTVDNSSLQSGFTNLYHAIAESSAKVTAAQKQASAATEGASPARLRYWAILAHAYSLVGGAALGMTTPVSAATAALAHAKAEQQAFVDQLKMATFRLGDVSNMAIKAGVSYGGFGTALGLASLAGVKWSTILHGSTAAWKDALQQIQGVTVGYMMMGQQGTALANDANAVTFSIEMQDSKVQQLNQAWQAWISTATGGESAFVSYAQGMATLHTDAGKAGASLNGLNANSLTLRSTFEQNITSASGMLQSLTSMAAASSNGAVDQRLLARANRDTIATFIPFARTSAQARAQVFALAQEAGYHGVNSLKAMTQWAGQQGASKAMRDLNRVIAQMTGQTSSLTRDVNNLGSALGINLNAQMAKVIATATGVDGAMSKAAAALFNNKTSVDASRKAVEAWTGAMTKMGMAPKQATQEVETLAGRAMAGLYQQLQRSHQPMSVIAADLARVGEKANLGRDQIATLVHTLTGMPKKEILGILMQLNGKNAGAGDFQKAGSDAAGGTGKGIVQSSGKVVAATQSLVKQLRAPLDALPAKTRTAGINADQGLVNGLHAGQGRVAAAAAQVAATITTAANAHLQNKSPSKVMRQIGLWAVQGLIQGILLGGTKMAGAIRNITNSIIRAFHDDLLSRGQESSLLAWVRADNTKLQQMAAKRAAIAKEISQVQATQAATQASFSSIIGLGHAPAPLTAAQQAKIPTAAQMVSNLQTELADIRKFAGDLQRLKKLGLDNAIISRIIAMGPIQGDAYAQALIAAAGKGAGGGANPGGTKGGPMLPGGVNPGGKLGGPPTNNMGGATGIIAQLNSAYDQITSMTKSYSDQVAGDMYGGGVAGAAGLVAGLKSQEKLLEKEMKHLAEVMIRSLRHDLRIHSPSGVMFDHGFMAAQGFAAGLNAGGPLIAAAVSSFDRILLRHPVNITPGDPLGGVGPLTPLTPHGVNTGGAGPLTPLMPRGVNPGGSVIQVHVHILGMNGQELNDHIHNISVPYVLHNAGSSAYPVPYGRR